VQHLLLSNTNQTAIGVTTRPGPSLDLNFAASLSTVDQVSGKNLVSFTRSSSGTYFDSAGVLRSATTNLLLRSEEFGTTWVPVRSSVSADAIIAPNGTLTADKIVENNEPGTHLISQSGTLISIVGARYTYSVYAKADGRDWLIISPGGTWGYAWFNISGGTLGTVVDGGGATTASITNVGNGWYRCVVSATAVDARGLQFLLSNTNNAVTYTGDGTSGLYLWGAQLEIGSVATAYIPTTSTVNSAPRFDHDPTTGESLGLLVEEQRTNLLLRSEEFNDASWTQVFLSENVTANSIAAPNGLLVADRVATINATAEFGVGQSATVTANIPTTVSIFAKAAASNFVYVRYYGGNTNLFYTIIVNLSTGIVTNTRTGLSTTAVSHSVIALPNGWYRISCTATHNSTTQFLIAGPCLTGTQAIGATFGEVPTAGTGNESIYLYGAQLETGAFATSYIPTTTSAVTRSADLASITGTAFSGWYRQDEGTIFSAFSIPTASTTGGARVYSIQNSAASTQIWLRLQGGTNRVYQVTDLSAQQAVLTPGTFSAGVVYRGAIALKTDDFGFSENGSAATVDNSGTLGTVDRMGIGMDAGGGVPLNGHIRRITYYPVRISNPLLQAITL
jgi:hypothetical protein